MENMEITGKPYSENEFSFLQSMFANISHLPTRTRMYIDSLASYYGVDHDIIVVEDTDCYSDACHMELAW